MNNDSEKNNDFARNTNAAINLANDAILPSSPITDADITYIKKNLLSNIASRDNVFTKVEPNKIYTSRPGAVLASPSRINSSFSQDYVFHWVRDSGIVISELVRIYKNSEDESEKHKLRTIFLDYIEWCRVAQVQPPVNGVHILGEPKFNIDGSIWQGEWARPQNDGPALRALSLLHIAEILLAEGERDFIQDNLYNMHLAQDKMGVIKIDLEYVANHWNYETIGLWEEVFCYRFFTELVQRCALIEGAKFAHEIGDHEAAKYYLQQAKHLEELIRAHWNDSTGYYAETLHQHHFKGGGIDSSIILGVLYGKIDNPHDFVAPDDAKIISSAYYIRYAFEGLYRINIKDDLTQTGGPLIGRYPSDTYDGNRSIYGNPWILTTCAFAEYYYVLAESLFRKRKIQISLLTWPFYRRICKNMGLHENQVISYEENPGLFLRIIQQIILAGDLMLQAVKYHSVDYSEDDRFHLSEQLDRLSGEQVSAKDLTWSYSTLLAACRARKTTLNALTTA